MLKNTIKSTFTGRLMISYLHVLECYLLPKVIDDKSAILHYYRKATGKELNLDYPKSFDEKLNWYKLNDRKPLIQQCADKVGVRDYIKDAGYGHTLNEVYGVFDNVKELNIDALPDQFVIKAAHGSHMNIIVKDKSLVNWRKASLLMRSWLHQDIAWGGREWCYKDIPKRLIVEKYIETSSGPLKDYKFLCFNGEPKLLLVDCNRFQGEHYRNYYYTDWTLFPYHDDVINKPEAQIVKPQCYDEMLEMARNLAKPFQHVRVDLYDVDGKIMFGELTFFHNGGNTHFPDEANMEIGKMWELVRY